MWSKHFSLLSLRSLRKDLVLRALKKNAGFHCGEYFNIVLITKLSGATSSQMGSITGHVLVCLFWLGTRKCHKTHILKFGPLTIVTVLVWKAERWNILGVSTCFILLPCTHSPSKKKNKCKVAAVAESWRQKYRKFRNKNGISIRTPACAYYPPKKPGKLSR